MPTSAAYSSSRHSARRRRPWRHAAPEVPCPTSSASMDSDPQGNAANSSSDIREESPPDCPPPRMDSGHRLVDRMPVNPSKMVFMSTQEIFEVPLRPDTSCGRASKKSRCSPRPSKSNNDAPRTYTRTHPDLLHVPDLREGVPVPIPTQQAQPSKRNRSPTKPTVNVLCNTRGVIFTISLLTPNQYAAFEALGFGPFLTLLTEPVQSKKLLPWLMDRIRPNDMVLKIGPGKNIPVTPRIISMVLGIPHGGTDLKLYEWRRGVQFRKDLIKELNQEYLTEDDPIHISNLQEEILKGKVDSLMIRCFFMIVFNRLLFPSTSQNISDRDIMRSMHPEDFGSIDWSKALFNNMQLAIRMWHD